MLHYIYSRNKNAILPLPFTDDAELIHNYLPLIHWQTFPGPEQHIPLDFSSLM